MSLPSISGPPVSAYSPSDLIEYWDSRRTSECSTIPQAICPAAVAVGTSGATYGLLSRARTSRTFTQMRIRCAAVGSSVTGLRLGIYDSTGAKLAETADLVASLASQSLITANLGSSVTAARGTYLYLALVETWTGSSATFYAYSSSTNLYSPSVAALATPASCLISTGWTPGAMPSTLSQVGANSAIPFWIEAL